jgi:hypothetical protein
MFCFRFLKSALYVQPSNGTTRTWADAINIFGLLNPKKLGNLKNQIL